LPVLEVRDVTKTFLLEKSKINVLEDVSFSVDKDEFICLVGPSGCGKSTLLRIIAGLEKADSGETLFHGQPQNHDDFPTLRFVALENRPRKRGDTA